MYSTFLSLIIKFNYLRCRYFLLQEEIRLAIILKVAPPGFEPGTKVPETSVLPLHHGAIIELQIYLSEFLNARFQQREMVN